MTAVLDATLAGWVGEALGSKVARATAIGSGSSRRVWATDLADGRRVVVREDTGTGPVAGTPLDLGREAAVYRALRDTDLPVPVLLAVAPDEKAIVLALAAGTADLKGLEAADKDAVARDYCRWLGALHALDPSALDLGPLAVAPGRSASRVDLALWQSIHDERTAGFATPAATFALGWLADHLPADDGAPVLCHGDAGPLNFLHEGGRVTAMLDWEFAHLGDPHDDLAWVAVRNQVLGSPIDLSLALRTWAETTRRPIDRERLEVFRALVLARMLVSCDATVRWTDGAETPDNRTQVVLRPLLAVLLVAALRAAGCIDPALGDLEDGALQAWTSSPLATHFGDRPTPTDLGAAL